MRDMPKQSALGSAMKIRRRTCLGLSLLIACALIGSALAIPKWYVHQRSQARQYIEELGGHLRYERKSIEQNEVNGRRKRETLLSALFDRRADDEAYIIKVDLHQVDQLPPMDELAGELRQFPNLLSVTFPNLLDPDDYIRGVLRKVGGIGSFVEGPVRNNRSDKNTSPDFIRGIN